MTSEAWPGRSWYQDEAGPDRSGAEPLNVDSDVDVAIVGGGLAGVATAVALVERGVDRVAVIEADEIGSGASGRNGGFVFAGYSLGNDALADQVGEDRAREMHGWTRASVAEVRRRIRDYGLDCQANDAGVVLTDWFHRPEAMQEFAERMQQRLGFELSWLDPERCAEHVRSPRYGGGLHEPGSFHFHPLRHIRELARWLIERGAKVWHHAPVRSIERVDGAWSLRLDGARVRAREVVLTTGGYDRRLRPAVQRALQPIATYIAVTEPLGDRLQECLPQPVAVYDNRFAFDYYRPLPDGRLLWGGRISIASRSPAAIRRLMGRDLARVFPSLQGVRLEQAWGGWMSYARHEMPLLGQLPDGLWHGLAFGGHGMATTVLAGQVLAEALSGDRRRLSAFEPWPARWAGGPIGRAVVQGKYWWLQARDWWASRGS
ncbi:NAD(P)/FAD-dependent oxidoreductase [Wenzhouxiangella marina]|uniref:FAD-dependent oxidoreductase n=1 Tax=Wenzhouxiangella marina TaxID=1579979 RepID=A0A0K0XWQ5_9GAMM|nr:FAD-dependent oxidoreductase [Wenzhouxiangella marina]AKS42134.1 FAD-dependent oxidoreductase [Wenzhouxiangella marina]MBB6086094.1 glycine/D-amino acid oxidase-like deaminating enzyme [Wenzhouxiangella marina]